jgi:hypothetical protein
MAKRTPGDILSAYFSAIGRKGGKTASAKLTKAQRIERARRAVQARWAKAKVKQKKSD